MDFSTAEHPYQLIAGLFQGQAVANGVRMAARHRNPVGKAKEARRMQHHHVQGMTLDPFAAIDQSTQGPQLPIDPDAEGVFDRVDGAHLVGDRANAADTRDEIRRFRVAAAAQQRLEETWRLKDPQLRRSDAAVADLQVERALALDAGEIIDPDRFSRHALRFP